jgi:hypothetical protein
MLAITDPSGDTAALLRTFEQVGLADIASADSIEGALLHLLAQRQGASADTIARINRERVMNYTRAAQAARLDALLRKLVMPANGTS